MIEIMVSVVLVGIATAFVFSIQVRMSSALHDQQSVSEVQQTLRSASELILRDVRMSGYLAQSVGLNQGGGIAIGPITVTNGGVNGGPDTITIVYADTSAMATINSNTAAIPNTGTAYNAPAGTFVSSIGGFGVGDVVLLTHYGATQGGGVTPPVGTTVLGAGCILAVTGTALAPSPAIKTDPTAGGAPWNSPANAHCTTVSSFGTLFDDGLTEFTKVVIHKYRIRPGDTRGVLEMSPSGEMVANDYQPLALGIVDMQIALRVWLPTASPPCAVDGDTTHDWLSSNNMNLGSLPAGAKVVQVSVTLLAKTTKEVQGIGTTQTPDLFDGDSLHRQCNHTGDVAGKALPDTSPTSMYYGDHVYRTYTATVDLRNANTTN